MSATVKFYHVFRSCLKRKDLQRSDRIVISAIMLTGVERKAVIAGTGFSDRAENFEVLETDYGAVTFAHLDLGGKDVIFVARHQKLQIPSHVNYRANVQALKLLGVNAVYTVSAAGRMAEEVLPGHLVNLGDLAFASTGMRECTFAEDGALILHTPLAAPFSLGMRETLDQAWGLARLAVVDLYFQHAGLSVGYHNDGTYFNSEPPWFNTVVQEEWLRCTVPRIKLIGQTMIPEVPLLREMGIAVASLGMCTDHSNYPGAVRVSHAGEGGVMDVAEVTAQAALAVLDHAIRLLPNDFYDAWANEVLKNSVHGSQVDMPLLQTKRPKLAGIIQTVIKTTPGA